MQLILVIYLQQIWTGCANSSTRGVFLEEQLIRQTQMINKYITISTLGNSAKFGDLTGGTREQLICYQMQQEVFDGWNDPAAVNVTIEYITIATLGRCSRFW